HIVTPLTDDIHTINNLLPALHPDMMPVPGSDAADAVSLGLSLLRSAGIRGGRLLLVTDGVADDAAQDIERQLRGSGVSLTVMGVGTWEGAPIPLPRGGFLKDDDGAIVMPRLEENTLRELAVAVGGHYTPMRIDDGDLQQLLATPTLTSAEQTLALDRTADTWEDQGYLLLILLLPLVLALFRRGWVLGLVPLLLIQAPDSHAQDWSALWATPDQQGQRALQQGDPEAAAGLFQHPGWAGTAAYESGDYEAAAEHFSAVPDADGWYNRGNALARAGMLEDALAAYEKSLQLDPGREDALANRELVEELKEQQEQQQQEQQGQDGEDGEQGEQDEQQEGQQSDSGANSDAQGDRRPDDQDSTDKTADQARGEPGEDGQDEDQREAAQRDGEEQDAGEPEEAPAAGTGEDEASEDALARGEPSAEEQERNQAMEQWLRRVPDDPSGLLREKFRYESRLRREEGRENDNEQVW
ncbi:MAG: tetratricopeptide repeat protein, partial [Halioglobus sp.]|nr:tetratricopeptide repeat protein [Halioglobus sp.]